MRRVNLKFLFLIVCLGIKMNIWFVTHWNPWFLRGGRQDNGCGTGVNAFVNDNGHAWGDNSFRVVLYYD